MPDKWSGLVEYEAISGDHEHGQEIFGADSTLAEFNGPVRSLLA